MGNARNQVKGNVNRIVGAAQGAAETMQDSMRDMPENLKSLNKELTERAYEGLDALNCLAAQVLEQGRGAVSEMEHRIEDSVRSRPLPALLIAFGIGVFVMMMAHSRRD